MENEKRLISAEQAYEVARLHHHDFAQSIADLTSLREVLEDCDTVDAVSRGVHDQVRWERDVAIEQLESYGISLGEKADVVKVVRCRDCKNVQKDELFGTLWCNGTIVKGDYFCASGERKDNERKAD
jgi:hypothetical protein